MADGHGADPLIRAAGLSVALGGRSVLQGIDMAVGPAEIVTVIGPNGAGKSTLVRSLLGLIAPSAGRVQRRPGLTIGYMPQKLHIEPSLPLTVGRFLGLARPLWGRRKAAKKIEAALQETGAAHVLNSPLQEISGGETQRVMLARALLRDPELMVLDEPVQGVDVGGQADLYRLISDLRQRRGCGVLMVSHDLHLVMAATDRVICLNGHVCCAGHPETVSRDPVYQQLFGRRTAEALAVYHHHHDHNHALTGEVVPRTKGDCLTCGHDHLMPGEGR